MVINKKEGFTLVELLVVIAILATLIALVLPSITGVSQKAQVLKCLRNFQELNMCLQEWKTINGTYPKGGTVDFWNKMRGKTTADPPPIAKDNKSFMCPATNIEISTEADNDVTRLDYTYPAADPVINDSSSPHRVISRDKKKNHGAANNINFLFFNGKAETLSKQNQKCQDLLAGQEPYGQQLGDDSTEGGGTPK